MERKNKKWLEEDFEDFFSSENEEEEEEEQNEKLLDCVSFLRKSLRSYNFLRF